MDRMKRILNSKAFRSAALLVCAAGVIFGAPLLNRPDGNEAKRALQGALVAQMGLHNKSVNEFPINAALSTNYNNARDVVNARKVGHHHERTNCSYFDIVAIRPGIGSLTHGNSLEGKNVLICVP